MLPLLPALLLPGGLGGARAAIDRRAFVGRHDVRFASARPAVDAGGYCTPSPGSTAYSQLTVGNGDFAFTADLTGLQSLNASYGSNSDHAFPALTQSSWGWHTPDYRRIDPTMPSPWRADGTLNLTLEDVPVVSVDDRPGHGNRTIPYLINCQKWNDPRLCAFYYNFPVRPCPTLRAPCSLSRRLLDPSRPGRC